MKHSDSAPIKVRANDNDRFVSISDYKDPFVSNARNPRDATMDIHFEVVREGRDIRGLLAANGWQLDESDPTHLTARHREVNDQQIARYRLDQLGLLTSAHLRIEFRFQSGATYSETRPGGQNRPCTPRP